MGLSAPLALLAAALVGLPIAAHLVRRADVERRVLPTVALLRRVVVRDRRRARITEPYLLALRVAAVVLAVLALSGPFLVDRLAYGDGSALSIVVVIDDSASMARVLDGDRSALDEARERARDIVRSVGDGSEIALVAAGSPPRLVVPRSPDRDAVLAALDRLRVGARRTDVEGALALASRQLASAHLAARRVVLLSDFAVDDAQGLRARSGAELELVAVAPEGAARNLGIAETRAVPDPLEAGAWSASVELSAFGEDLPSSVAMVVLALPPGTGLPDGSVELPELTRANVELSAGHGRAVLRFRPPEGVSNVALRLLDTGDASGFDDVRVLALRRPRASRVVFVEPAGARTARFATRALAAVPEEAGAFLATAVDADHLAAHRAGQIDPEAEARPDPLAEADVLVLTGIVPTSPSALEAIRAFVEGGGGLLVAPGPGTRAIDLEPLADLLPAETGELVEGPRALDAAPAVVAGEGPALLPPGPNGLESLVVARRLTIDAPPETVCLRSSDGAPLLVIDEEHRRAILSVSLDDQLSDLPLRVGFVPLLVSLARSLARPGALPDRPFAAGEAPALRVDPSVTGVEIVTPTGEVLSRAIDHRRVALDDLFAPGAYSLRVEQDGRMRELERATLVLVPPATEIDLTARPAPAQRSRTEHASEGETRRPIERWFYLLVGLLAAIEAFARLGRFDRLRRSAA